MGGPEGPFGAVGVAFGRIWGSLGTGLGASGSLLGLLEGCPGGLLAPSPGLDQLRTIFFLKIVFFLGPPKRQV